MKIEMISREIIKPSSPTPNHLHHYKFSFLDQIAPPVYIPLIFFYNLDNKFSKIDISNKLKLSLSETLTHYYLLAGRVKDDLDIDCNDEGVPFLEAKANCQLSQIIQEPFPNEFNKFLPYEEYDNVNLVLAIQVNFFDCGGIAVGALISHKIADGSSFVTFVKSWAAIARGDSDSVSPQFVCATLFPPKNISGYEPNIGMTKENLVLKRFVFSGSNIASLKAKYDNRASLDSATSPTRVEALSAFIWSRFTAATQMKPGPEKVCMLVHAVNLRTRMDPQLPECSFGNIFGSAVAFPSSDNREECYGLTSKLRDGIRKINKDYVKKLQQDGDEHLGFMIDGAQRVTKGEVVPFSYTSMCKFPVYEADFGWGKPTWVGWGALPYKNLVVFIDTKCGDGIEAWVHLKEEDMAKFESDKELLELVNDKELLEYVSPTQHI